MSTTLAASWARVLADELTAPYFLDLQMFLNRERRQHTVFPLADEVFAAFEMTPYERVRVLLLGQDPYHDEGQAHGLCFSVRPGVPPPASLRNVFRELHDDLGYTVPRHGYLAAWAQRGVLLLNTVLTVRAHAAGSHRGHGWEQFTDAVIRKINEKSDPVVFILWGRPAQQKTRWIDPLARGAQNVGDLVVAEGLVIAEDDRSALLQRQRVEGLPDRMALFVGDGDFVRRRLGTGFRIGIAAVKRRGLAAMVVAQAGDDAIEVGAKRGRWLVARGRLQDSQEGFLGDILRFVGIAQQPEGDIPGRGLMPPRQHLEGGHLAASRRRHQFFVALHFRPW